MVRKSRCKPLEPDLRARPIISKTRPCFKNAFSKNRWRQNYQFGVSTKPTKGERRRRLPRGHFEGLTSRFRSYGSRFCYGKRTTERKDDRGSPQVLTLLESWSSKSSHFAILFHAFGRDGSMFCHRKRRTERKDDRGSLRVLTLLESLSSYSCTASYVEMHPRERRNLYTWPCLLPFQSLRGNGTTERSAGRNERQSARLENGTISRLSVLAHRERSASVTVWQTGR